jgi:lipopolysaccharide biosynthesis regulator YciM
MRQGVKLRSLDKHNENIIRLVEIQQCNAYIEMAQKKLNSGDVDGAISVLRKGVQLHPENVTLREMLPRVRQLRNAKKLIRGMKSATTSIAMRSALTAAKIGLSLNTTPALQKYFDRYEKRIEAVEVKEKAEAEAKEKAEREKAEAEAKEKAEREKAEKSSAAKKAPKEPELSPADKK